MLGAIPDGTPKGVAAPVLGGGLERFAAVRNLILRFLFGSVAVPLTEEQKRILEQRRLSDLAINSRPWLLILLIACAAVWLEITRQPRISPDHLWTLGWSAALASAMLPYFPLQRRLKGLGENPTFRRLRLTHFMWCAWLAIVALVWLSGAGTLHQRDTNAPDHFILWRQTFIYLTLLGQVFTVCLLAPSSLALFSIICCSIGAPILIAKATGSLAVSFTNFYIFYVGHVLMYLLVSAFVAVNQRQFYIRDILLEDARSRAVAERMRANKFIEFISHDLKSPLQSMALSISRLEKRTKSKADVHDVISELQNQADSLGEMVKAAFDFSRLEASTWSVRLRAAELPPIIDRVYSEFRPIAVNEGLLLERSAVPHYQVLTDPDALKRILRNLLGNAIKYTPSRSVDGRGRIRLECELRDKVIQISVVDNGIGVPDTKTEAIFDEYVQLNNPERGGAKGVGLGLSIVKGLANKLDHELDVESHEGQGSRFSVMVPIVAKIPEEQPETVDLAGMNVVLIEDNQQHREGITELLLELGCDVLAAESGDEAIAKLREGELVGPPHFILSDYRLLKDDGIGAIAAIRAEVGSLPAAICSAESSPETLARCRGAGFEIVEKPIKKMELGAVLVKYCPLIE
jgi:signal transduction histidine kinase/CheY-like chemotaxis protein